MRRNTLILFIAVCIAGMYTCTSFAGEDCKESCEKEVTVTCETECEKACEKEVTVTCETECEKACEEPCKEKCEAKCKDICEKECIWKCEVECEEPSKTPVQMVDFSSESTNWVPGNLTIGPVEILSAPFAPVIGGLLGGVVGVVAPFDIMKSDWCALLLPYTTVAGIGTGAIFGAATSPILLIEGTFNTLTGGAFADHPFDWFVSPQTHIQVTTITEEVETEDTSPPETE